jgi:hypothetical protein
MTGKNLKRVWFGFTKRGREGSKGGREREKRASKVRGRGDRKRE